MSRATNKLKTRLRAAEAARVRAEALSRVRKRQMDIINGQLAREAALTIKFADQPQGLLRHGKHFRIDFVVDAFEFDFLRRGNPDVSGYASMIGQQLARQVAQVIQDHIAGKPTL